MARVELLREIPKTSRKILLATSASIFLAVGCSSTGNETQNPIVSPSNTEIVQSFQPTNPSESIVIPSPLKTETPTQSPFEVQSIFTPEYRNVSFEQLNDEIKIMYQKHPELINSEIVSQTTLNAFISDCNRTKSMSMCSNVVYSLNQMYSNYEYNDLYPINVDSYDFSLSLLGIPAKPRFDGLLLIKGVK